MIIGHPGTWQQFQFRPDNKGLNIMEMKSKYLHEQYLFEAQMLNLQQMQQQNPFMNGVGGGAPSSEPEPTPPPPTYAAEAQFYFGGTEAEVGEELGWDPKIPSSWRDNVFNGSISIGDLEITGDGVSVFIVTLRSNDEYTATLAQDAFGDIARLTRVIDVNDNFIFEVGPRCFLNCTGLTDVQLNAVTIVDDRSFGDCSSLETVSFTSLETIPNGSDISGVQGVFMNCPLNSLDFELNFPALTTIGNYAFYGCNGFRSIISSTISSVGFRAFAQVSSGLSLLDEVSIQCSTNVGDRAFQNNNLLTAISMPFDNTYNANAFTGVGENGGAVFNAADEDDPSFSQLLGWGISYVS